MGADCELCKADIFLEIPGGTADEADKVHAIRKLLYGRDGAITLCTAHGEDVEKLGYDLSRSGIHTRPNRRTRRAAKAKNLTRAQRKAATDGH